MNANNNVFAAAITAIADEMINGNGEEEMAILQAFSKNSNSSWLPLAWAVIAGERVKEEDTQLIFATDPVALQR